ncbi:MAG: hypothetical protein AVDCRST_MAG90-1506 [uncultured Microvirga sp.]|uniref:Uncharacterized protein n=1 Tax=uncultured Microvirga sp. TaxID=412392 RepID=A0A6J4LH43_9HYPH|nr:MAG: hypothetical protein AVDCRST_MAG90-1506 [uncultured Microvirga sp.]
MPTLQAGAGCAFFAITTIALLLRGFRADIEFERRRERGQCRRCGYDLRASGYRCPECGTPRRQPAIEPIEPNDLD